MIIVTADNSSVPLALCKNFQLRSADQIFLSLVHIYLVLLVNEIVIFRKIQSIFSSKK